MNPLEIALKRELTAHGYKWLLEPVYMEEKRSELDLIERVANTTVQVCYELSDKTKNRQIYQEALLDLAVTVSNMINEPPPKRLHVSSYDPNADRIVIEGIAYSGDLFRGMRSFQIGSVFRVVQRDFDGAIHLERVQPVQEPTND